MAIVGSANGTTDLNGLFKTVYADKIQNLVPDFALLQKMIDFSPADKEIGAFYAQPVALTQEGGFSYNGEVDPAAPSQLATLNDAVAGVMKEAQVKGSELVLRSQMTYKAVSRAAQAGTKAFKKATAWKVEDMNNSARKRLEISMLYGQSGIGTVASTAVNTVVLTAATWSTGIWSGTEGHSIDVFPAAGGTSLVTLVVSSVDPDAKSVTFTASAALAVAGTILFFKGAATNTTTGVYNEMAGLVKIISNTGSLFGINAGTYNLWKGNTVTSAGTISHAKIQAWVAKAVSRGLMTKAVLLLSPTAYGVLNSDASALRAYDGSYKAAKGDNGFESIVYKSTNGEIEVVSHPFVKDGDAILVPLEFVKRIGSVDLTFELDGERFFFYIPGANGIELQCMADQAVFLEKPSQAVYISGITYS